MTLIQKYPNREHIVKGVIFLIYKYEDATIKYLPSILAFLFSKMQETEDRYVCKEYMYSLTGALKILLENAPDNSKYAAIVT